MDRGFQTLVERIEMWPVILKAINLNDCGIWIDVIRKPERIALVTKNTPSASNPTPSRQHQTSEEEVA